MALVCHMEKYKQSDCGGIQTEDNRESEAINKKNPSLDLTKTHLNKHFSYNLGNGEIYETKRSTLVDIVRGHKERINIFRNLYNKPKVRKDAVVCCSFIIGADNDYMSTLTYEKQIEYFKTAVQFFENNKKYGSIMEYSMHFDEGGAPHMHLRILPEIGEWELSAKKMFTPQTLAEIQRKLPLWMNEHGFEVEAGREGSPAKHLNEAEFRIKCANDKITELENKIDMLLSHSEALERGLIASYEAEDVLSHLNGLKDLLPPEFQMYSEKQNQKIQNLRTRIQKADEIVRRNRQPIKKKPTFDRDDR